LANRADKRGLGGLGGKPKNVLRVDFGKIGEKERWGNT